VPWGHFEANVYWGLFSAALLGIALWEMLRPWRGVSKHLVRRWRNHAALFFGSIIFIAGIFRTGAILIAVAVSNNHFGLFHWVPVPFFARAILAVLLLDLLQYGIHRASHAVPVLWRLHSVHHSDPDLDLSTGFRHHPFETLIVQAVYFAVIALLAPPVVSVFAVELLGLFQDFFTHANANLPQPLEKIVRAFLITPEMHRVHHSDAIGEQSANLGTVFPFWDRLFGTYLEAPSTGLDGIRIGLKGLDPAACSGLVFMLAQPFHSTVTEAPSPSSPGAVPAGIPEPQ